ncbi:MAG TPA: aldo/keto reductase [Candidatus Atopostipes pullistercoris]|uniref:Aldo/keto reductase n=1 Tax=Candidatus Atopostipes pullistercoris TaxID=2838467 RepID=A0A9D2G3H5_9LACT|nr:aldo/keto reductase [Candidatus Atopostipes pullistercoris]
MEIPNVRLNDGHEIPCIGLGTIDLMGNKGVLQILDAIHAGYRLIDTSTNYDNEGIVGKAVQESSISRDQLLVSSKLPGKYHDFDSALTIIEEQLARTGLEYFDKYLIHWPNPDDGKYVEAWKALIQAQKLGMVRTIGVSNFLEHHLEKIINETGVTPATNQIEVQPYFHNKENVKANEKFGIVTEAWSPLGRDINDAKQHPDIVEIGEKYNKSAPQVIVRWLHQRDIVPIVRSGNPVHQKDNLDIFDFELTDDEMDKIFALDKGEEGRVEDQNPDEYHEYV